MKGGITSGLVYPRAMARVARDYRIRSIGGTSIGAIAAALTAAATKDAADARALAHSAELLAAEAQATARTLREVLDTISKNTKDDTGKK